MRFLRLRKMPVAMLSNRSSFSSSQKSQLNRPYIRCRRREVVIDAAGRRVVRLERHRGRVLIVLLAVGRARLVRQREVLEDVLRDRAIMPGGMMLPGNGSRTKRPGRRRARPRRERVVDLVLRAEREQLREVAGAHLRRRHRHDVRRRDLERVRFDVGEVERPVRLDRAADRAAEPVVVVVPLRAVVDPIEVVLARRGSAPRNHS